MKVVRPAAAVLMALLATGLPMVACGPANSAGPPGASKSSATPSASPCTPAPCGIYNGLTTAASLTSASFQAGQYDQPPAAGTQYAQVTLSFSNAGSQTQMINPYDFKLQDSSGTQRLVVIVSNCIPWTVVSLAAGGHYGPVNACYEAAPGKLVLVWQPNPLLPAINIPLN